MSSIDELLAAYPRAEAVDPADVTSGFDASGRILIVLDDDPTGTQSVEPH